MKDNLVTLLNEILPFATFDTIGKEHSLKEFRRGYRKAYTLDGMLGSIPLEYFIFAEVDVDASVKAKVRRLR